MIDLKQQFLVDDLSMFTLKSFLERLKRDFDGSKIFFFSVYKQVIGFSFQHVISLISMV